MTEAVVGALALLSDEAYGALVLAVGLVVGAWKRVSWRGVSSIKVLVELARLGAKIYPVVTVGSLVRRVEILGYWITHANVLRQWFYRSDNADLDVALKRNPLICGAIHWSYMHRDWPMLQRLRTIDHHYRLLGGDARVLSAAIRGDLEVARLDAEYAGLRLVLDTPAWFMREGEVVLSLFLDSRRIISIAFTLAKAAGRLVALVGAIQGFHGNDALLINRDITRALHGLRPKDLIVLALRFLCGAIGVVGIRAVSSDMQQQNSRYFGGAFGKKVHLDYDSVWTEHGGTRHADGFFDIPVAVKQIDRSELPSHKRAQYRRRYAMLDGLARDIDGFCRSVRRSLCSGANAPAAPRLLG